MPSTLDVLVQAVHDKLVDVPSCGIGVLALSENQKPPRIVWVPQGGHIVPPRLREDVQYELKGKKYKARHIHDDLLKVSAHVWAADYEKLERLRGRVLSAVRECFKTASEPGEYTIATHAEKAGYMVNGHAGWQSFVWRLRICQFTANMRTEAGTMVPGRAVVTILNTTHACEFTSAENPADVVFVQSGDGSQLVSSSGAPIVEG